VASPVDAPSGRACLVVVDDRLLGVDVREAREVLIVDRPTPVPGAPPHVHGLVSRRGAIVPILDLRPLLGSAPGGLGPGAKALVVDTGPVAAGLAIDAALGLASVHGLRPVGESERRGAGVYGRGWFGAEAGGAPALLLDIPRVLAAFREVVARSGGGGGPVAAPARAATRGASGSD
jgi:purine-binding chemotaxis protein CheW